MIESDAGKFGDGDCQDGEIDACNPKAERKKTDESAGCRRNRNCDNETEPGRCAEVHEQCSRSVGAKPDVKRVAERKVSGKAHQDVPGLSGIGEIKHEDEHGQQIIAGEQRRSDQYSQQHSQHDQGAWPNPLGKTRNHALLLPRMPCGRASSTSTRMANTNIDLADGVNSNPAIASVNPINTPPMMAPGIEPMPPMI